MELLIRVTIIAAIAALAFAASSNVPAEPVLAASAVQVHETAVHQVGKSSVDRGIENATAQRNGAQSSSSTQNGSQKRPVARSKSQSVRQEAPVKAAAVTFLSLIALVAIARRGVSVLPDNSEKTSGNDGAARALARFVNQSPVKGVKHAENSTR